jgi:ligand-binding sensor domain-containing protein/signal transduction histidine kinase
MIKGSYRIIACCLALTPFVCAALVCVFYDEAALALDRNRPLARYGHDVWQREQGLPNNTIHVIVQTRDGYIWLATDGGLVRFDGVHFDVFDSQNTPEIPSNQIQFLLEDKRGTLWIGTTRGLTRLQDKRFTGFTTNDGLADRAISSICEDHEGNLWLGTAAGLNEFRDGKFNTYKTRDGLPNDSIRSIFEDRSGVLWIGTLGGLVRFESRRFTAYTIKDGLPNDTVEAVYEDRKGVLWINTPGGLAAFSNGRFTSYSTANGLLSDRIWSIEEDRAGNLWIGSDGGLNSFTNGEFKAYTTEAGLPEKSVWSIQEDHDGDLWLGTPGGLARLKDGKLAVYTSKDGLSDDVVMALLEDREGSLWIGTERGGLNRLRDAKFTTYSTREGLTNDAVLTVCQSGDASIWSGTNGGGLNRFKDARFTSYTSKDGLASNIVRALCEDSAGNLWAGTPAGLNRLRSGEIKTYTVEDGLSSNAVFAIEEDREGVLWIGTLGGLTRFKDGQFTVYTARDGLSDDSVISLRAARDGGLWIGTRSGGLCAMQNGRFVSYRARDWLADDSVRAIYEDEDGAVWVGTRSSGLSRYKNGQFTTYTTKEGLFDDCVFEIIEDERNDLWLTSPKGVFRVSKKDLNDLAEGKPARIASTSFDTSDGMLSRECSSGQPAGCRSSDGKLWFPTIKGIATIDPNNMPINLQAPPVAIERAIVDGNLTELTDRTELTPGRQRYEFHYTALSLVAPEKVRFKYMLEGFDKDWVDAGAQRVASYTQIAPGSYKFRVLACNNDGVWNETGASVNLYLKPYFYQTYWFYAVCGTVVGLVGLGLYRLRVQRIRSQFSAVLEERNRMAREIHDTLAQSLVGIALQLQAVEKALPDAPETAERHLSLAHSMVNHSLVEARRSIWDLRSKALETDDLATALSATARQMTEGTGVRVDVRVAGDPRRLPAQIENHALRIAQESLTNALRHADAKLVTIEAKFNSASLELRIEDDGRGFDVPGVLTAADGHFGLRGMHERVEHMGGELVVKSIPGEGTEIIATIPIK